MRFQKMCDILPEGESQGVRIEHYEVSEEDAQFENMRAAFNGGGYIKPGKYCRLIVNGSLMMSDTPDEARTNSMFMSMAQGDVLIGGLGLGAVTHTVAARDNVNSITIVELNRGVIDLVAGTLPDKCQVIQSDVFEYKPPKGAKFDTIYFDIWPDICTDNLDGINKLHQRAKYWKRPGGWMSSWMVDKLRYLKKNDRWR